MTGLSDATLLELCRHGALVPGAGRPQVQSASIDLHLGEVCSEDGRMRTGDAWTEITMMGHSFLLGSTVEKLKVPDHIMGKVEGKSSLARLGLMVECGGFVDPGFEGNITLELFCLVPQPRWRLRRGMPIAQVVFWWLDGPAEVPYGAVGGGNHYQGQRGATISHLHPKAGEDRRGFVQAPSQ